MTLFCKVKQSCKQDSKAKHALLSCMPADTYEYVMGFNVLAEDNGQLNFSAYKN